MPKKNAKQLQSQYKQALEIDREIFAEMRSNMLLIAGEHYVRKNVRFWNRVRDNRTVTNDQRLRLTKNHIQRIAKIYHANLVRHSPNVTILPDVETELQDQKAAQLHGSIWKAIWEENRLKREVRAWSKDFVDAGECFVKVFYDYSLGEVVGYEPLVNEEGEQLFDAQTGEPLPDEQRPIMSGMFVFEKIFPGNVLRDPDSKSMQESPYWIIQKMMNTDTLKQKYPDLAEDIKNDSDDSDFLVFEGNTAKYTMSKNKTLVKETYYQPSEEYPSGYYYVHTDTVVLEEGELPGGIWPFVASGFDEIQTSPRHRSIVKQIRPYQIEINRCASAIATAQITLGDDKVILNNASKIESAGYLPGVRLYKSQGPSNSVQIVPGRSGEQYLNYMNDQITEMYDVANVREEMEDRQDTNADPYLALFRSIKEKKKFSYYTDKFEDFLVDICRLTLRLAKMYLPEDKVVRMVGRHEMVNISEFKNAEDLGYQIKVKPMSDDIETMLGKQITLNHALQYVGGQMDQDQIGKVMRNMPFANMEEAFGDFTINYDNARNDILALERGEKPPVNQYDDHDYMIKKLVHRMKQSDFRFLDPVIQQNFQNKLMMHQQIKAKELQEIQYAQSGFIPSGGYLVKADFYVTTKDGKNKRAVVPSEAMEWLMQKLEEQGRTLESVEKMQQGAQADISEMLIQAQAAPPQGAQ